MLGWYDMDKKKPKIKDEGDNMLAIRKNNVEKNNKNYVPAKTKDISKAIMKSNKKHAKMMNMLAK